MTAEGLVGDDVQVQLLGDTSRHYVNLDYAASTSAHPAVLKAVYDFLPWYSSVHRGAGAKSRFATEAYEAAREAVLRFAGAQPASHVAVFTRNTTEALNLAAFRLRLRQDDMVVATVAEHHANLLPWRRHARVRYVEVAPDGTFSVDDVVAALDEHPLPKVLAMTGASNVTGWMPPVAEIAGAARARGVTVVLDAAQLAPHRRLRMNELGVDLLAFSGHKMYAPFGAGVLVGPRQLFATGEPFLAGGGAVDIVDLEDVVWTEPPDRDEAGSPNVVGAIALHAVIRHLETIGEEALAAHERALTARLDARLAAISGLIRYGPAIGHERLPLATFNVIGQHHALVAARLAFEFGIGVRHGCFCAHPYLTRLLGLKAEQIIAFRESVLRGDRSDVPGAIRASAGLGTTLAHIDALGDALEIIARDPRPPVPYGQDQHGDFLPEGHAPSRSWDPGLAPPAVRGWRGTR